MGPTTTSPFLRANSADWSDMVTDGAVEVLRDRSADGLTISAIARWIGITPSALSQQIGKRTGGLDVGPHHRLLTIVTARFARRWLQWSGFPDDGGLLRLPRGPEECHGVHVWHLLHDVARARAAVGDVGPSTVLEETRVEEDALVRAALGRITGRAVPADRARLAGDLLRGAQWTATLDGTAPDPAIVTAAAVAAVAAAVSGPGG